MVSRRTRVAFWIFRRDHPSRPRAMICCFFSSFKTFAMSREATNPHAAVNVLDVCSESMAAFQVFLYGRFWVFTEDEASLSMIGLNSFDTIRSTPTASLQSYHAFPGRMRNNCATTSRRLHEVLSWLSERH